MEIQIIVDHREIPPEIEVEMKEKARRDRRTKRQRRQRKQSRKRVRWCKEKERIK
jgi:hypothetical protein